MTRDEHVGNCEICGLPMLVRHPLHFFCSDECRDRSLESRTDPAMPDADSMGVRVLRRRVQVGADHEWMPAVDALGRTNEGYSITDPYIAYPEPVAEQMARVIAAAREWSRGTGENALAEEQALDRALDDLDALTTPEAS